MSAAYDSAAAPPFWVPVLAGLPIGACMILMALPALGNHHAEAYRVLFLVAFLLWTPALTLLQRWLWRRGTPVAVTVVTLLLVTYLMALLNNLFGIAMALIAGWGLSPAFRWSGVFGGVDECWYALIAFCAIHGVVAYYAALKHEQQQRQAALTLARDAELRALRYQLQPHFLFNTLNAISALVANHQEREACQMIARLGEFLRATLEGGEDHEVPLADELALTETYLDIEKARLGNRLALKWQIGPDVLGARVPYLLLQPLVENAIRHGIALRREPGRLEIRIERVAERLHIRLSNDLATLPAAAQESASTGLALGLRNISERLAMLYSQDHHVATQCSEAAGYEVQLDLPYRDASASAGATP